MINSTQTANTEIFFIMLLNRKALFIKQKRQ